ncbi:hypothetical protein V8E53_008091 [Lactarius tabidus]
MPPRSTRSNKRSGAGAPPETPAPTPPARSVQPPTSTAVDSLYGFLAKVPSPVTLPSSYSAAQQLAAAPIPTPRNDPYAFLEKVPSLVTLPPSPAAPSSYSQPVQGLQGPQTHSCNERITVSDTLSLSASSSHDSDAIMELSTQPSIVGLPESGKSSEHGVRAQNAELLARRLSRTPPINKIDASRVPEVLEERLKAARRILDIQLEESADFRKELNHSDLSAYGSWAIEYSSLADTCMYFKYPPINTAPLPTHAVVPTARPPQAAPPQHPPVSSGIDPFAFMAIVPSRVQIPQAATVSTALSPFPSLSQLATLPSHMAAGDSTISFLANVPSPTLSVDADSMFNESQDDIDRITASDSSLPDSDIQEISTPEDVLTFPESSIAASYAQRSRTVEVLSRHLSRAPPVNQINAHPVPLTLEERLHEAEVVIDQALGNLETFRSDLSDCNDILLRHTLVLSSVKEYLYP